MTAWLDEKAKHTMHSGTEYQSRERESEKVRKRMNGRKSGTSTAVAENESHWYWQWHVYDSLGKWRSPVHTHTHTHTTSSSNSSHRHDRLQLQCSEWLLLVHRLATTVSASSSAALWRPPQTLPQQNHFCQQIVIQRAQWHFLHIFLAICFHFAYSLAWNDFPFIAVNTKLHHLYNLWKLIKERKVAVVHR